MYNDNSNNYAVASSAASPYGNNATAANTDFSNSNANYHNMSSSQSGNNTTPRLSAEQSERLVKRLYYQQMQIATQREQERQAVLEKELSQSKKHISKSEEEELVRRMYDIQLQKLAALKDERERRVDLEMHKNDKTLDSDDLESHIHRMYDEELEKSRRRKEELMNRFCPTQKAKTINKEKLKECVERLYHVDWEKRDEELFKKYVYPNDPKVTRISKSTEEAMAARLSTRKSEEELKKIQCVN